MKDWQLIEIKKNLEFFKKLISIRLFFAVFNEEGVALYINPIDDLEHKIRVGEVFLDPSGMLQEVLNTGQTMTNLLPAFLDSMDLICNLVPVFDENKVSGCVVVSYVSIEQQVSKANEQIIKEKNFLIEQLKQVNDAVLKNGMSDELTEMYNRKGMLYFSDKIFFDSMKDEKKLFVYVADLNGLKYINDYFGHAEGDKAISMLGKAIKNSASEDIICARTGGDEFMMLASLPYDSREPEQITKRIIRRLNQYDKNENLPYMVEASFGYYYGCPDKEKGLEDYVSIADERMYEMKRQLKSLKSDFVESDGVDDRDLDYGKDRILIVDDSKLIRMVLKNSLKDKYIVIEANDGNEALNFVEQENEISMILLDVEMPGLNGFQVLQQLREKKYLETIPVIMMTGLDEEKIEERGYKEGVSDFIHKPLNPNIILYRIENIVQLYKRQRQLTKLLEDKVKIVENQAKRLANQAEQLKDS